METKCSAGRHSLHRMPDQFQENRLEFHREPADDSFAVVLPGYSDFVELHTARLQFENLVEKRGNRYLNGRLRLQIKGERLARNVSHTKKLLFAQLREIACLIVKRRMVAEQVEGIRDRF